MRKLKKLYNNFKLAFLDSKIWTILLFVFQVLFIYFLVALVVFSIRNSINKQNEYKYELSLFNEAYIQNVIDLEQSISNEYLANNELISLDNSTRNEIVEYLAFLQMNRDSYILKMISDYFKSKEFMIKNWEFDSNNYDSNNLSYFYNDLEKTIIETDLDYINDITKEQFLSSDEIEQLSLKYLENKDCWTKYNSFEKCYYNNLIKINENDSEKIKYVKKLIVLKFWNSYEEYINKINWKSLTEFIQLDLNHIKNDIYSSINDNYILKWYNPNFYEKLEYLNWEISKTKNYLLTKLVKNKITNLEKWIINGIKYENAIPEKK